LWWDGSRLKSRQHGGRRQRTFPPQEGHDRTRIGKWQRGNEDEVDDVLEVDVGVVNRPDDVDGLVQVIVVIVVERRKGRVRRRLALVECICKRPEIRLQGSVLAGADLLDPQRRASSCRQ
jgi:hypothetical protein